MSKSLGVTTVGTVESRAIFWGMKENYELEDIVILSGEDLKRGCLLGKVTASGKYQPYKPDAADGTETIAGVLGCDVDATEGDEPAFMYITGEFNKSALTYYAGASGSNLDNGVHDDGDCFIVLKSEEAV